jgi:glycine dehydrogenase subunit 1
VQYATQLLNKIDGVKAPIFKSAHFKEFTVNFDKTKKTVNDIHGQLSQNNIHGGKNVTEEFSELGETALYCVTEVHSKEDIDSLAETLKQIIEER